MNDRGRPRPPEEPTVFIVDDDRDVREALEGLLRSVALPVESFASAEAFAASRRAADPGCLVLDIRLTGRSGLRFQQDLVAAGSRMPIVFVSGHVDVAMTVQAMKAGAAEVLTKPVRPQELIDAVQAALARDAALRAEGIARARVALAEASLTPREREVMGLVVLGLSSLQVATRLGISEPTVKAHRVTILRKMGASSVVELVRIVTAAAPAPSHLFGPGLARPV